jgi:hypothetical protein
MPKKEKPGGSTGAVTTRHVGESLALLMAGLQEASRLFAEGKDGGRHGAIAALNAVIQFLLGFEGATQFRQPLIALVDALVSLDDGRVLPILKPHPRSGRPPASAIEEDIKAVAAMTVHRLGETGLELNEAYERVAKVCREAGLKPARKGAKDSQGQKAEITARTVRLWCEKIAEDVGRRSQAAQTFDRLLQSQSSRAEAIAQAIEGQDTEAVRERLLEGLRPSLMEMLPHKPT